MKLLLSVALVVISGCSAIDEEKVAKNKNGFECKQVSVIGSSIPKRVCTTSAQREQIKRAAKDTVNDIRSAKSTCSVVSCSG